MERVLKFLKEVETYYLATVEGDQPRVRPFGTAHIFEGKFVYSDWKGKGCIKANSQQIQKIEIMMHLRYGEWLRVAGELVEDDRKRSKTVYA